MNTKTLTPRVGTSKPTCPRKLRKRVAEYEQKIIKMKMDLMREKESHSLRTYAQMVSTLNQPRRSAVISTPYTEEIWALDFETLENRVVAFATRPIR